MKMNKPGEAAINFRLLWRNRHPIEISLLPFNWSKNAFYRGRSAICTSSNGKLPNVINVILTNKENYYGSVKTFRLISSLFNILLTHHMNIWLYIPSSKSSDFFFLVFNWHKPPYIMFAGFSNPSFPLLILIILNQLVLLTIIPWLPAHKAWSRYKIIQLNEIILKNGQQLLGCQSINRRTTIKLRHSDLHNTTATKWETSYFE